MSDNKTAAFDLDTVQAADEAEFEFVHPETGEPTGWKITFAGPNHPKTIEARNNLLRKNLKEAKRLRGKQLADDAIDYRESIREIVDALVARVLRWTPVTIKGEDVPFTAENARNLFMTNPYLRQQAHAWVNDEVNFIKRSATP